MRSVWMIFVMVTFSFAFAFSVCAEEEMQNVRWDRPYAGFALGALYGGGDPDVSTIAYSYFNKSDKRQLDSEASQKNSQILPFFALFGGHNFQIDDFVFGLEADFALTPTDKEYFSGPIKYDSASSAFSIESAVKTNWMASLRPRVGYAFDKSLVYISGGPALSKFNYRFQFSDNHPPLSGPASASLEKDTGMKLGWAFGGGYEQVLSNGWRMKLEYLHYEFKNIVDDVKTPIQSPWPDPDAFIHNINYRTDSIRFGLYITF